MKELNQGKQMKDVWTGALTKPSDENRGKTPNSEARVSAGTDSACFDAGGAVYSGSFLWFWYNWCRSCASATGIYWN